jgi:hypothetical protein
VHLPKKTTMEALLELVLPSVLAGEEAEEASADAASSEWDWAKALVPAELQGLFQLSRFESGEPLALLPFQLYLE